MALSASIGAHELGHLVGLVHADSFGPLGSGIPVRPGSDALIPAYPGPNAAFETTSHLMATGGSVGSRIGDALTSFLAA